MSSAPRKRRFPSLALIFDTVRIHRTSAIIWVVGAYVSNYAISVSVTKELSKFPGGTKAFAKSLEPSLEALKIMRWPAERLDTIGGYISYHNLSLFTFFLAIYGAVQGAKALRGDEDRRSLEEILATGWSRSAVIRDRTIGFFLTMILISLGMGLGVALSLYQGNEPDLGGSLIQMSATCLVGMVGYGLGALVSQFTVSATTASGICTILLSIVYVGNNVWDDIGPFGVVRFISPFYFYNFSRALVPGYGFDLPSLLALFSMVAILTLFAVLAFIRRDYRSPLWTRKVSAAPTPARRVRVQRPILNSVWTSTLYRGRIGYLSWAVGTAFFAAMMAALEPSIADAWSKLDFMTQLSGGTSAISTSKQYLSLGGDLMQPFIAAFVVAEAAKWVSDLASGRVEITLATPISWTRLVFERLLATLGGLVLVSIVTLGALVGAAVAVGAKTEMPGIMRLAAGYILIGTALASICAIFVALIRTNIAVISLSVFVGASYLVGVLVPILNWPESITHYSIFYALGHPYLAWPSFSSWWVLLAFAIPGGWLATFIAERTPKVA